jgi:hypothetical protein
VQPVNGKENSEAKRASLFFYFPSAKKHNFVAFFVFIYDRIAKTH